MENQSTLTCVSCESTFDPAPHGGFCPDCDTPHPDFGRSETEEEDAEPAEETAESESDGSKDPAAIQEALEEDDEDADADAVDEDDAETDEADGDEAESEDEESEGEVKEDDSDVEGDDAEVDDESEDIEEDAAESDVDEGNDAADEDTDPGTVDCGSCGATVDAAASFCPECGSEIDADEPEEPVELDACPDCGYSVDDESFCPQCGTDLDAIRNGEGGDSTEVTLVIDGESYTFGDGDTFGRQENEWLEALVRASGGPEEVKYVSGNHLEFSVEDDGVYVTDASTNGTDLNGEDLEGGRSQLEDGDTLTLAGRAEITVEL